MEQKNLQTKINDTKIITVHDFFEKQRDIIKKALPKTITPDRMIGLFTMLVNSSPVLMNCSQSSLIAAVIQTIQLGFLPGPTGHVYYVPFKNKKQDGSYVKEVQFILGYKGMIELINRSGNAAILSAECVHEKDEFIYSFGLNPDLMHKPAKEDRGKIIGVYCIAKNKIVNEKVFNYLSKEEIDKVRNASRAGQSEFSPWNNWYEEMAKKTAIKRLAKLLPLSIDIQKQLSTDETIKTEISADMTQIKDETTWEESPIDATPEQPAIEDKTGVKKQEASSSVLTKSPLPQNIQDAIAKARTKVGDKIYQTVIGGLGFEKMEQILDIKTANKLLEELGKEYAKTRE